MSDIEQALAEALRMSPGWLHAVVLDPAQAEAAAAAILATPSMQAIARQAAIGAAVERLGDLWSISRHSLDGDPCWQVNGGDHFPTLPEAIAAALGDDE